jgi:hypothetical protein
LGRADRQADLLDDVMRFCDETLPETSIYAVLHRERDRLFPDEMFADLFQGTGRNSVPPSVVATVTVLQRLFGLSDREAVERYTYDSRWRYAAVVGGYDGTGWNQFAHTVLVDMRARLARSDDPRRIFNVVLQVASAAGLVGKKRVLDSTPIYDAVATMDTITLIRSAIRGLLRVAEPELQTRLRAVLTSGDDYADNGKPPIAWDDEQARLELIDSRAKDGHACLIVVDGQTLSEGVAQASQLLATVLGQDLETSDDGVFRIARRVAKDRIVSTVDPQTRHGHKTSNRGFDGYKGHIAIDPDSEIITDTIVTAGNAGDASVATDLVTDLTATAGDKPDSAPEDIGNHGGGGAAAGAGDGADEDGERPRVYGDSSYGTGEFHKHLEDHGIDDRCKTQQRGGRDGMFHKDAFDVDLEQDTVTCPNATTVPVRRNDDGEGTAYFAGACAGCPLRAQCTTAAGGRTIKVGRHEKQLADARWRQKSPEWTDDYRSTRPKVERKLGHLTRRGRRAHRRGTHKIDADFNLQAAAENLARLSRLGLRYIVGGWAVAIA